MTEPAEPGVRVSGDPDQKASPQHDDLEEDLDALVDLETQRIMDEADLLEFVSVSLQACPVTRNAVTGT